MRLDVFLVENGFVASRNKAHELIKNAFVLVDNIVVTKPSFIVQGEEIRILKDEIFVSRAGEKLAFYIRAHNMDFSGMDVLDIGSSKGGFTQALLQSGARSVTCVDVGKDQLDILLRRDPRVKVFESCDIREFRAPPFDFVVCDVSFISLKHILDSIIRLSKSESLLLFKPQFELVRNIKRNKKGVVQDKNATLRELDSMFGLLEACGLNIVRSELCALKGKEGNEEIFIHIAKK